TEERPFAPLADRDAMDELVSAHLAVRDGDRCALHPASLADALLAGLTPDDRDRLHRAALARPDLTHGMRFGLWRGAGDAAQALAAAERALEAGADLRLAVEAAALAASGDSETAAHWQARAGSLLNERGR